MSWKLESNAFTTTTATKYSLQKQLVIPKLEPSLIPQILDRPDLVSTFAVSTRENRSPIFVSFFHENNISFFIPEHQGLPQDSLIRLNASNWSNRFIRLPICKDCTLDISDFHISNLPIRIQAWRRRLGSLSNSVLQIHSGQHTIAREYFPTDISQRSNFESSWLHC